MVELCTTGPTTMKPTFYKPVLVLFFWFRNVIKFLVSKHNRAGLQSCFAMNTAHLTSTQAECKNLKKAWL